MITYIDGRHESSKDHVLGFVTLITTLRESVTVVYSVDQQGYMSKYHYPIIVTVDAPNRLVSDWESHDYILRR